jgi:hypothetical protein
MPEEQTAQPTPDQAQPPAADPQGYPANTPVADMSPEQQASYWKTQARKHEGRASERADYDQLKSELDKLRAATQTESEKAINEAKALGRTEAVREINGGAVMALLEGALTLRGKSDEQVSSALRYINVDAFIADGVPDTKAIIAFADSLAPATGAFVPDFGAGNRGTQSIVTGRAAGLSEAERRFGKKQ